MQPSQRLGDKPLGSRRRTYGPEYGPEAIRRLEAGLPISYRRAGVLIEEHPDGRRFEIRIEPDYSTTYIRELSPTE
jgi:hypothetical protein